MSETDLVMTVKFAPGTMTLQKCRKIQKTATELVNAIANDIRPGSGELYKLRRFEWIDDGKDEMTIRFSVQPPAPTTGATGEE